MANKQTLKNTANRRQEEIRQTVGGSNNLAQNSNSRFDRKNGADKIPVLNVSEYQTALENVNPVKNIFGGTSITGMLTGGGDENYNRVQELTPLYNALQATRTQNQLDRLGQTDIARGASDALVDDIKNQGQGNLLQRYINTPYSVPNVISNLVQNATADKGTLTPEMQALGITENDLANWNARQNEAERQEVLSQWAKGNPVVSSINAVPENAFQSISNTLKQIKDYATGTPLQTRETNADIYRRAVSEDIDSNIGQLAYGGANSLADMLFATLLTAPLGGIGGGANAARNVSRAAGAIMGTEKANQVMNSAIERGLTPNQIMGEGVGSGVSTALTEALPLEGILGGNHILSSMLSEGLQEGAEDLVDTAIDELITRMGGNGDKSELHQNYNAYLEAGYDADEAFKNMLVDYGKQVGIDALLGGITGGLMGGSSNLMQGRNIITGRIPTIQNVQTEENVTEPIVEQSRPEQRIPDITDAYANMYAQEAEQANRARRENDLANAYANMYSQEARNAEDARRAEEIARREEAYARAYGEEARQAQDYDPETDDYLRAILTSTARDSKNWDIMSQDEKVTNEVEGQKNRVLEAINSRNPLTGEIIDNFVEYVREVGRTNPNLVDYLRATLNEVGNASKGWRTNYNSAIPELWNQEMNDEVARSNFDIDDDNFLRSTLSELNNEPIPTVENVKKNETPDEQTIPTIEQPVEQQIEQPSHLTLTELTQYRRQMEGLRDKLSTFGKKKDANRLTKAYEKIANTEGKAQEKAVENFNKVVDSINEKMAGETVGVTAREVNQDLYDDMKRVTDGYKIRVSKDAIKQLGLDTYTELNNATNTRSANRIKFVEKGGTPIDSAYMEMYDLAHGTLPDPTSMAEGDLLKALYNYITEPKSSRDEMAYEESWEDVPVTNTQSAAGSQIEDIATDFYDKLSDGTATADGLNEAFNRLNEISRKSKGKLRDVCIKVYQALSEAFNNNDLDEDVANIKTGREALQKLGDAINGMRVDLAFFSEKADGNEDADFEEDRDVHTGEYKTSKLSTKTVPNSGIVTDTEFKENFNNADKRYEKVTHEATLNRAEELIKNNGYKGETDRVLNSTKEDQWSAVDTDAAMMCFKRATDNARHAESLGIDKKEAWKTASDLFRKIREHATVGGQAIEALKKWSMNTPEGKLAQAIAYANEAEGKQTADDNYLGQLKKAEKANKITFSDEFVQEFLEKAHSLDDDPNATKSQKAMLDVELAQMVLNQVPKKFRYKFTAFWMDNLLASARTLLTRNVGGNLGKFALEQTATKAISGPIDKLASKLTGERTTTGLNGKAFMAGVRGAGRSLANTTKGYWFANAEPDAKFKDLVKDFKTLKENLTISGDTKLQNRPGINEDNFVDVIKNNRSPFNDKGIEKVFKVYNKLINYGLAISDDPFYGFVYNQTISELNQIRNDPKKYGGSFSKMSDEQFEMFSKAIATAKGLEAVYQDNTKMSEGAMAIKDGIGKITEDMLGIDVLSNPMFPFVRTPMNVIRTNLEYNPLGIVKNVINTIREVNKNLQEGRNAFDTTSFDQNRFVRETSRNIVGSLLWIGGLAMAYGGLLTGSYSDNKKEKEAQKQAGMQEYAYASPFTGNQYSIDWIPALGSDLISSAAFYDAANKNPDASVGEALGSGLKEGAKSMFEMSALQGLQRLTGSGYNSDKNIVNNAIQSLANTASSAAVPAFVRQIAQAMDPYKRDTYSGDDREDIISAFKNNIPILRETLEPRIGSNGKPMEQNAGRSTAQKWFDNLLNPATVTVPSALQDPVRDEAMRLFEETRSYDAFQPKMERSYLETDDHTTNAEEFRKFSRNANSAMNEIASSVIESDFYQDLDDEDKQKMLKNIYDAVRQGERAEILGTEDDLKGAAKAYYEGGEEGLIDYLTIGSALNQMGLNNNASYRPTIQEKIDEGGAEAVQQMVSDSLTLTDLGASQNMIFKYDHASQYIPSLNPETFYETFNTIDTSNNESITQAELIDYINSGKYDEQAAMQLWQAYGGNWVKIPVLNEDTGLYEVKKV